MVLIIAILCVILGIVLIRFRKKITSIIVLAEDFKPLYELSSYLMGLFIIGFGIFLILLFFGLIK